MIRDSSISENVRDGVGVFDHAKLEVEDVLLERNGGVGLAIGGSSVASVTNAGIRQNRWWTGIWIGDFATAEISRCTVQDQTGNGIAIGDGARVEVLCCEIIANSSNGIWMDQLVEPSSITLIGNLLYRNGIGISLGSAVTTVSIEGWDNSAPAEGPAANEGGDVYPEWLRYLIGG